MKKVWRYLSKQIPKDDKPNIEQLNYIIEPLCCVIKLAILSFYPIGTKISIHNNTIEFVKPNALQGPIRWSYGDRREDLHHLHNPLIKAAEWYKPLTNQNKDLTQLFIYAIDGLKVLKKSYFNSSTIICHSLDLYIDILRKCISDANDLPINKYSKDSHKNNGDRVHKNDGRTDDDAKGAGNGMMTRSKKLKKEASNLTDSFKKELSFYRDTNGNTSINSGGSLSTDENSNEDSNDLKMKQTTLLGKQLKGMWTEGKIRIIISLFKELELDKENKKHYLSSITNVVHIVERKVTDLLFNVKTFQESLDI